jgi:hypothetical protein
LHNLLSFVRSDKPFSCSAIFPEIDLLARVGGFNDFRGGPN